MNFFFDRCLPRRLAQIIEIYDTAHSIRHHDDDPRFNETTTDVDWMRALALDSPTWIVVSGDLGILRNRAERAVLREANLSFFSLTKQWTKNMPFHEMAWRFLRIWPEIVKNSHPESPRIFEISAGKGTKVTLIGRTKD